MLKLAGLLLLFSSATLTGFYAAAAVQDKEEVVLRQISFWRQFMLQLECLRGTPRQLTGMLCSQSEFEDDRFFTALCMAFKSTESFFVALHSAVEQGHLLRECGVDTLLLPLGDVIGVCELELQLAALRSLLLRLEERREVMHQQTCQRGGLYRRLGIFGGLLLAVLFF